MTTIGRAATTYVDRHVEHTAFHHTHQLGLRVGRLLEMEAAHHTVAGARLVVLHKGDIRHLGEVAGVVTLEEIATGITEHTRLDNDNAFNICLYNIHLTSSIFNRYCPY